MGSNDTLAALFGDDSFSRGDPDLNAFKAIVAKNNLLDIASRSILGSKFDTSTWNPGTSFGVTAAQAFLGGMLKNLGAEQEGEQLAKAASVFPSLYKDPINTPTPEGIDPEAFGGLRLAALKSNEDKTSNINSALFKELFGAKLSGVKSELEEAGKLKAQGAAGGLLNPANKAANDIEEKARDALKSVPLVNNFQDVKTSFDTMKNTYALNNKPATLAFVSSFARVLDPGSVVREGEIKNAENTQSFLQSLGYSIQSLVDGSQSIGPIAKKQMLEAAAAKYNNFGRDFQSFLTSQQDLVERLGGRRENVFAPAAYEPFDFTQWDSGGAGGLNVKAQLEAIRDKLKSGALSVEEKTALLNKARQLAAPPTTKGGTPLG